MQYLKSGSLFAEKDEEGRFVYIGTKPDHAPLPAYCREQPFAIDYAIYERGEEIYGAGENFSLRESSEKISVYTSQDERAEVKVLQKIYRGVLSQKVTLTNRSGGKLCLKQLYNQFGGIATDCISDNYLTRAEIGVVRGEWGGEGQLHWESPETLGLFRATGHNTRCTGEICSPASYTTRKYSPLVFFRDTKTGCVWAVQHLPEGPYCMEIGLTDAERVEGSAYKIACGAGSSEKHGFRLYLAPRKSYTCAETLITCAPSLEGAIENLNAYRRRYLKKHPRAPLMFNDYMNSLWCNLREDNCLSLLGAAQAAGAEGYCFDDGWYRAADVNGSTHLGDWIPCDERFGSRTFAEMIEEIRNRGMIAGLWTELEVCSPLSDAANFPKSYFLTNEGERIFRCGRYYFNFANKQVREYLMGRLRRIYAMGIRYIKNDYNGHPGCGVDWKGASPYAGLEQHCRAVQSFYRAVRKEFPDLILENCASGAMRADGHMMENFDTQSISDCEEYDKMPSIINGAELCLLPEQISVWAYPYPRVFWEMNGDDYLTPAYISERSDGEETIFNIINGMMGNMLLSGKIDVADEENFQLIRRGVALLKEWRPFVDNASPIYPLGCARLTDRNSFVAHGLKRGKTVLLAVWRREGQESRVFVPLGKITAVRELYPCRDRITEKSGDGIFVTLPKRNQAVLLEVTVRS